MRGGRLSKPLRTVPFGQLDKDCNKLCMIFESSPLLPSPDPLTEFDPFVQKGRVDANRSYGLHVLPKINQQEEESVKKKVKKCLATGQTAGFYVSSQPCAAVFYLCSAILPPQRGGSSCHPRICKNLQFFG